jgi:hypothetical protein
MFAEDVEAPSTDPKLTETVHDDKEPERDERSVPKYSDADLDKIINSKFAAWQKQQEKKVSEAERLSKMTAEEKAAEELKAIRAELDGYKTAAARAEMMKQGRAMLQDKNIVVGDELLANLIAEDAEDTKAAVESFISMFNAAVEKAVKEALKGEPPKAGSAPTGMTKEQILAIPNRAERQRLMKEHKDLF